MENHSQAHKTRHSAQVCLLELYCEDPNAGLSMIIQQLDKSIPDDRGLISPVERFAKAIPNPIHCEFEKDILRRARYIDSLSVSGSLHHVIIHTNQQRPALKLKDRDNNEVYSGPNETVRFFEDFAKYLTVDKLNGGYVREHISEQALQELLEFLFDMYAAFRFMDKHKTVGMEVDTFYMSANAISAVLRYHIRIIRGDEEEKIRLFKRVAELKDRRSSGEMWKFLNELGITDRSRNCIVCGRKTLQVCSLCRKTRYCSKPCQQSDWPVHRINCKTYRDEYRQAGIPLPGQIPLKSGSLLLPASPLINAFKTPPDISKNQTLTPIL